MTTYDWTVTIDGVNVSALVKAGGTIDYGRPTRNTGFSAPVAVFELFTQTTFPNYGGSWPTVNLEDDVIIHVTWDGVTQNRRFTGKVQALDWNPTGLRVTAAGTSVEWQRITADGIEDDISPYADDISDETETARVQRLVDDAGVSITIEGVPARRVRAIPAGEIAQPLLDGLLRIADDCDALLMEDRLGVVHYRTRNFDRPAPYTIPTDIIERDSIDLAYERGTHINAVRVFYGEPDPVTGQQNAVYSNDTATYGTIVTVGERLAELYTDIQYQGGAAGKASVYLEKNRLEWVVPDVVLMMSQATGAEADDIFDLQENWMVTVGSLPTGCPISSYAGDILGITDVMHETDYRVILHLGPRIADTGGVPEEPIFDADSITGGTTSTYEDEFGFLWQLHVWDSPGSYTITCNSAVTGEALVIGGGGGGGNGNQFRGGGGGGAGAVLPRDISLTPGSVNVTVGAGGAPATSGGTSKLAGAWAYGGGAGGNAQASGANGGCGGGAGQNGAAVGVATYGSLDGGATTNTTVVLGANGYFGVGRGGFGGGLSYVSTITNASVTYSVGGAQSPGGGSGTGPNGATPGSGGGGGGTSSSSGGSGAAGIVVYRYRIG